MNESYALTGLIILSMAVANKFGEDMGWLVFGILLFLCGIGGSMLSYLNGSRPKDDDDEG